MIFSSTLKKVTAYATLVAMLVLCGCEKLIDINPPTTSINQDNVFNSDNTAIAALTGIYASMSNTAESAGFTGNSGLSVLAGLSSDELTLYDGVTDNGLNAYYKNSLVATPEQSYGSEFWPNLYNYIFKCNAAIEGLNSSNSLTPSVKQQLLGEAKFMRAFFYFYLINLYGNAPLALTTDPSVNAGLARTSTQQVYEQILRDLKDAQNSLSDSYLNGSLGSYTATAERVRPTKWAATALLARVYLYVQDYADAEAEATAIINETSLFSLAALKNVFLKNSTEAIWQLQPVKTGRNTEDAFVFILPPTGPGSYLNPVYLSPQLLNSFENSDLREATWIGSVVVNGTAYYYPYKYKATTTSGNVKEYLMMFRLAEQYLIRAEARAQQGKISDAQSDLNAIRSRAGLANTAANDQQSLLTAVLHERQTELFTELGSRWFDLKRTGNVDDVMSKVTPLKGGTWNPNWQLYPLPFEEIERDPALVQNPGY